MIKTSGFDARLWSGYNHGVLQQTAVGHCAVVLYPLSWCRSIAAAISYVWLYVQLGGVRAVQLCTCTLSVCLAENLRATNVKPKQISVHVVETVVVGDLLTFSASRHSCGLQTSLACQISLLKHLLKDL